jgi:hypothetical protein
VKEFAAFLPHLTGEGAIGSAPFETHSPLIHSDAKLIKLSRNNVGELESGWFRVLLFFAMLDELLTGNGGIIKLPAGASYRLEDVIAVISYAATSTANSVEAAVAELKRKQPDAVIPSADTVFKYLATNEVDDVLRFFRQVNSELFSVTGMPKEPVDIAVDFHDCPYYGDKSDPSVRGIKPKNGTSWGHSFFTLDLVGIPKLTLDIVSVNALNKDYAALFEAVINRRKDRRLKIGTLFLDREFFNFASIRTLSSLQVNFIMAAPSNKRIKRLWEEHKRENGLIPAIFTYRFKAPDSPVFSLIAIPNPDHPTTGVEKKSEFLLFATNVDFGSLRSFVSRVPEEYKRRWNIETGYRVKNVFKIRTCAKKALPRVLFFAMQCLLHNYLNVLKRILELSAQRLKALVAEDIEQLQRGVVFRVPRFREFYAALRGYNMRRQRELRARLAVAT